MASESGGDSLLTVDEVANLLKLNPQTVRNRIDAGELPAIRIGRRVRVQQSALEQLIGWRPSERQTSSASSEVEPAAIDHEAVATALEDIAAGVLRLAAAFRKS